MCDTTLQTSAPGIYAAGDCARWPNAVFSGFDDEKMRIEHWTNAAEQGAAAARNMLMVARGEQPTPYESVPFFWSDQFDSRIQFVGRAHGGDETLNLVDVLDALVGSSPRGIAFDAGTDVNRERCAARPNLQDAIGHVCRRESTT